MMNLVRYSALLSLLMATITVQAESRPPLGFRCEKYYTSLANLPQETAPSADPGRWNITNYREYLLRYAESPQQNVSRVPLPSSEELWCLAPGLCFAKLSAEGDTWLVKDVHGRQYYWKYLSLTGIDTASVRISAEPKLSSSERLSLHSVAKLRAKFISDPISKIRDEELALALTTQQLKTSSNAQAQPSQSLFRKGILEANRLLVRVLGEDAIALEHLEQVNWHVNQGVNPFGNEKYSYVAGVLRGSNDRAAWIGETLVQVNLESNDISQGLGGKVANYFFPADQVKPALSAWLAKVNAVNGATSPEEIFGLYKNFIEIHPFMDGNGRTGRILLNYLLLKAKLPPMKEPSQSLYYSSEELSHAYMRSLGAD